MGNLVYKLDKKTVIDMSSAVWASKHETSLWGRPGKKGWDVAVTRAGCGFNSTETRTTTRKCSYLTHISNDFRVWFDNTLWTWFYREHLQLLDYYDGWQFVFDQIIGQTTLGTFRKLQSLKNIHIIFKLSLESSEVRNLYNAELRSEEPVLWMPAINFVTWHKRQVCGENKFSFWS